MNSLVKQAYVTTGADGGAQTVFAPDAAADMWLVTRLIVTGDAPGNFVVYLNSTNPASTLDNTSAPQNDMSETSILVGAQDKLIGVWTECPPNTRYSFTIMGELR